jgi:hypothetical protein
MFTSLNKLRGRSTSKGDGASAAEQAAAAAVAEEAALLAGAGSLAEALAATAARVVELAARSGGVLLGDERPELVCMCSQLERVRAWLLSMVVFSAQTLLAHYRLHTLPACRPESRERTAQHGSLRSCAFACRQLTRPAGLDCCVASQVFSHGLRQPAARSGTLGGWLSGRKTSAFAVLQALEHGGRQGPRLLLGAEAIARMQVGRALPEPLQQAPLATLWVVPVPGQRELCCSVLHVWSCGCCWLLLAAAATPHSKEWVHRHLAGRPHGA